LYVAPDYTTIPNKPSINNVTLEGNKSLSDLGIVDASPIDTRVTATQTMIASAFDST
jgi:hypothetical protein